MEKKKKILLISSFILGLLLVIFVFNFIKKGDELEMKTTDDIDVSINTDDSDSDINWSVFEEELISRDSIIITEGGIYRLTGNISNVSVNTISDVKLILDNVTIKSSNGPAILIEEANNTVIVLEDNSVNILEDSENYETLDTDINGVIYSKDDLILEGNGSLEIKANYGDGITSLDDLKIIGGTYTITSVDDGIRGKDSVYIKDGEFLITSGGDGIKSTNDANLEKGYILIENGIFNIESELDGMQAETKLVIKEGDFSIKTGGGSENASSLNTWGSWGENPMIDTESVDTSSAKGLKSADNLVILGGTFHFDTSDDTLHSNNYLGIKSGEILITSGDDGIHADSELIIDSGIINILKSYEGLEAAKITINGGDISVVSSDDGINVAGGNDSSSMNRPGENQYRENTDNKLIINEGIISVNATGDGIDVNGSAYMYGGKVVVLGPTNDGNGTLDYDLEFIVDGGEMIATGSSGMLQMISSDNQYNVIVAFSNQYQENTKISILDDNNKEIISHTPTKSFSSLILSSPFLEKGKTYKLEIDEEIYQTFEIKEYTTAIGRVSNHQMPGGGNMGGGRR